MDTVGLLYENSPEILLSKIISMEQLVPYQEPLISGEAERWDKFKKIIQAIWDFIKSAIQKMYDLVMRIIKGFRYRADQLARLVKDSYKYDVKDVYVRTNVCYTTQYYVAGTKRVPDLNLQANNYVASAERFGKILEGEMSNPNITQTGFNWNAICKALIIPGFKNVDGQEVIAYGGSYLVEYTGLDGVTRDAKTGEVVSRSPVKFEVKRDDKKAQIYDTELFTKQDCLTLLNNVANAKNIITKSLHKALSVSEKFCKTLETKGVGLRDANQVRGFVSQLYPHYMKTSVDLTKDAMNLVEVMCRVVRDLPTQRKGKLLVQFLYSDKKPKYIVN